MNTEELDTTLPTMTLSGAGVSDLLFVAGKMRRDLEMVQKMRHPFSTETSGLSMAYS